MLPGGPIIGTALVSAEGHLLAKRVGRYSIIEVYDRDAPIGGSPVAQPILVEVREHDQRTFQIESKGGWILVEALGPMLDRMKRPPTIEEINAAFASTGLEKALQDFVEEIITNCATELTPESDTPNSNGETSPPAP